MRPPPIVSYVVGAHAEFEARRRGVSAEIIRRVLADPEQQLTVRPGRVVVQSIVAMADPTRRYLVRIVVDVDRTPAEVVTVYRTTKIAKYWKGQS